MKRQKDKLTVHVATHVSEATAKKFEQKTKPIHKSLRLRMLIEDFNKKSK